MFLLTVAVLALSLGLCHAHTDPSCLDPGVATPPGCTLSFSPWMSPQIPPTTTIYEAIMTTYLDVVDCRYCTVTIPNSKVVASAVGPFTAKVTSPMLTITRVGCMLETSAVTRGGPRDYAETVVPGLELKRSTVVKEFSGAELQQVAQAIAHQVGPDNSQLPERVYEDLVSLNTALFAIYYVSQHLNLTAACEEFRQPLDPDQMPDSNIDRNQAANIFCWGEQFGLDFGISLLELADKLAAAIYILLVGQSLPSDLGQLCSYLDIPFAGFLGINATSILEDACEGGNVTSTTALTQTSAMPLTSGPSNPNNSGSPSLPLSSQSGRPPVWSNSSFPPPTNTGPGGSCTTSME